MPVDSVKSFKLSFIFLERYHLASIGSCCLNYLYVPFTGFSVSMGQFHEQFYKVTISEELWDLTAFTN